MEKFKGRPSDLSPAPSYIRDWPDHESEQSRLAVLDRYDVLDSSPEPAFDRITMLVKHILRVPIATLTLVDGHRQWFKSRQGLDVAETPRCHAFCNYTIREARPMIVCDAMKDPRFLRNPLVTGAPHIRFYAGVPLRTPDGYNIGTLCAIDTRARILYDSEIAALSELAALAMEQLELRQLATIDSLTGALSRRAFRDEASRAIALAQRAGHDLSCIAIDLDHFKSINDTHGHGVGDEVLRRSLGIFQAELRKSDFIGRIGGEEFAAILPHTDRKSALVVAHKLRDAIGEAGFKAANETFFVTASFGVGSLHGSVPDLDALLHDVDAALYQAKAKGRNCCVEASFPEGVIRDVRRHVLKAGSITFDRRGPIDCTVRQISDHGARLDVSSSADVPSSFELVIEAERFSKHCRVDIQRNTQLEVSFV